MNIILIILNSHNKLAYRNIYVKLINNNNNFVNNKIINRINLFKRLNKSYKKIY